MGTIYPFCTYKLTSFGRPNKNYVITVGFSLPVNFSIWLRLLNLVIRLSKASVTGTFNFFGSLQ